MFALKNQYLREMGVDVWVLRKERPAATTPVRTEVAESASEAIETARRLAAPHPESALTPPAKPGKASVAPAKTTQAIPEFHLCFATLDQLSLVFSVPSNATSLPDPLRRFVGDIALALGDTAAPSITALKWPMVKASHINQSEEDARVIVGQRVGKCAGRMVLLGEAASTYATSKKPTLIVDEIGRYFAEPLLKRELWKQLREFVKARES